ncbi:MAG: SDR family oxidoreductase [Deltaproteobacteria bacterium]|nr:SDR family oxidoreductase [Deltaproteobacteria bacterium]
MARKILLYGGSGGIGSAIARLLHKNGDELYLIGRNSEKLEELASQTGAHCLAGDITQEGFYQTVMDQAGKEIDGLVYAVGTINLGSLRRLSAADFLNDFHVNAMGAALAVKAALSSLKKAQNGSSVVLFSSVAAQQGFSLHASIGMAKGAVSGLTRSLAAELAPKIRVNAIAPSLTQTPLSESLLSNRQIAEAIAGQHALKRLGSPEDIAHMAVFLLSSEASWITGQIIGVDGGRSSLQINS